MGSEAKTVEVFRRGEDGVWSFVPYGEGDEIAITSVDISISVDAIYEDVLLASSGAL